MAPLLDHAYAWLQDTPVSPEFIDDESAYSVALLLLQQSHRPIELREHTSPVYISDQQHGGIHQLCKPHIHDVIFPEIDLRRASGPLDHDDVRARLKAVISRKDLGNQLPLIPKILPRGHISAYLALHNELRAGVPGRF